MDRKRLFALPAAFVSASPMAIGMVESAGECMTRSGAVTFGIRSSDANEYAASERTGSQG